MPIVINDLEVIAPPAPHEPAQQSKPQNTPQPGPTPEVSNWVMRRLVARHLRLRAD